MGCYGKYVLRQADGAKTDAGGRCVRKTCICSRGIHLWPFHLNGPLKWPADIVLMILIKESEVKSTTAGEGGHKY